MVELYATEIAAEYTETVVRLRGGHGFFNESQIGRVYRDVRMLLIHKGVSKIQCDIVYENF